MTVYTTAVFENGRLTPLKPLVGISDHSVVRIVVESSVPVDAEQQLRMLSEVPVDTELADAIEEGRRRAWRVEEF